MELTSASISMPNAFKIKDNSVYTNRCIQYSEFL